MLKTEANIINGSDVKVEGKFRLDIDMPTRQPARPSSQPAATTTPKVIIIENNPQYALIEFTCACGAKSRIQCRYDQTQPPTNQPQ